MKTRVKKKQFKHVEDTDLIGVVWANGEKGLLIETKTGVAIINTRIVNTKTAVISPTKSEYLNNTQIKKVFLFGNNREMLKWFAKK